MSHMTKDYFLRLIRITIYEFHRDVMIPLDKNIHLYDRERNKYAIHLHEQFKTFSNAVYDLYSDVTDEIKELDDAQLSELLQLCKDISELYNLPVLGSMPVDCTIGLDNTNETSGFYAQRLAQLNVDIYNELIYMVETSTKDIRQLQSFINILNRFNPGEEGKTILDEIEKQIRQVQTSIESLPNWVPGRSITNWITNSIENIMPLFPDTHQRKIMDNFLEDLRTTNIPPTMNLNSLIERRDAILNTLSENGIDPAEIAEYEYDSNVERRGLNLSISFSQASIEWSNENTTIEASITLPPILSLNVKRVVQENTRFIFTFGYGIIDNNFSGSAGVIHNLNVTGGLSRFDIRGSFNYSGNDLVIIFDTGAEFLLNRFTHIDLSGSLTPLGNNPRGAIGVNHTINRGGGGLRRGIRAEVADNNVTTNFSFQIEQDNNSIDGGMKIPLLGRDISRLFYLRVRIRF